MRRRHDGVELLPFELEREDADPHGSIVEIGPGARRRRRGRDGLLLVAAVALVAGIALTLDGGADGAPEEAAPARTERPRVERPRTSTTFPRSTTTTLALGEVRATPGTGALTATPTRTAVAVTDGDDGEIHVIDLDTGDRCETRLRGGGGWFERPTGPRAITYTPNGPADIGADCTIRFFQVRQGIEVVATGDDGHVWAASYEDEGMHVFHLNGDGGAVGQLDLPHGIGGFHAVDGGLVVNIFGSVTFVDTSTEDAREIGRGVTLAARGQRVAILECEALDCRLVVHDLQGRVRSTPDDLGEVQPHQGAAMSPDGRWLAVQAGPGMAGLVLLDVETGLLRSLGRVQPGAVAFTETGSHVVSLAGGRLSLHPVEGGEPVQLGDLPVGAQSFAVIARP